MRKEIIYSGLAVALFSGLSAQVFDNLRVQPPADEKPENEDNLVAYQASLAVGVRNWSVYRSGAFGTDNRSYWHSFASGFLNDVGSMSAAFGRENMVNKSNPSVWGYSFAAGYKNTVYGRRSTALGYDNYLVADDATAIGTALKNNNSHSIVMGKYNVDKPDLLFSIGDGIGPAVTERSNAFEIYDDGTASLYGSPLLTEASAVNYLSPNNNGVIVTSHSQSIGANTIGNTSGNALAIAIGTNNILGAPGFFGSFSSLNSTIVSGDGNEVETSKSFVIGENNEMFSVSNHGGGSVVFGEGNKVVGSNSFASGIGNVIGDDATNNAAAASTVFGQQNVTLGITSFIAGHSNEVTANYASALGVGLSVGAQRATIIGSYNQTKGNSSSDFSSETEPLLVVGNGANDTQRSDALIIKRNGDIIIPKPQGDVSMGVYGN